MDADYAQEDEGATTAGSEGSDSEDSDNDWEIHPEAWSILNDMMSSRSGSTGHRQGPQRRTRVSKYKGLSNLKP